MGQPASRSHARELVLQALYALEIGSGSPDRITADILAADLNESTLQFASALFDYVRQHQADLDESISALSENWKLDRMAVIDRIILRMAAAELNLMPDVPVKVVLNEAIELAKQFSTAESSAFINGILDSYLKTGLNKSES